MKKLIALLISKYIFWVANGAATIWIIVEFLVYLVKDSPFNWWSLYSYCIVSVIAVALTIIHALEEGKYLKETRTFEPSAGAFEKRLKQAMKKQEELKSKN